MICVVVIGGVGGRAGAGLWLVARDLPPSVHTDQTPTARAMAGLLRLLLFIGCVHLALFADPSSEDECVIELSCEECLPEHMPLVTSHEAAGGRVRARPGDELALACAGGRFLAYPLRAAITAVCERGRLRVRHDHAVRHLLELGCQEDIFEDVQHTVEHCGAPLQGRAYRMREGGGGARGVRHVALLCWDADGGAARWARATGARGNALPLAPHAERAGPLTLLGNFDHMFDAGTRGAARWARATGARGNALPLAPHAERAGPLTLLGNFDHMFDAGTRAAAERLYSDDARMTRRVRELLKHDKFSFAGQTLTAGRLLAEAYFEDQNARAAHFVSNRVPVWASVAAGNLHHLQRDVARLLRAARPNTTLDVFAGTHEVSSLRGTDGRRALHLRPGRFPVPRYIWTVVHDAGRRRALAVVLLNEPFVAVSEVRGSVRCDSACAGAAWLTSLRTQRRYETPLYGLVFCCGVHELADFVPDVPRAVFADVPRGPAGMLVDSYEQ